MYLSITICPSPILKTIGFEAGLEQGIAEGKRLGKEAEDE